MSASSSARLSLSAHWMSSTRTISVHRPPSDVGARGASRRPHRARDAILFASGLFASGGGLPRPLPGLPAARRACRALETHAGAARRWGEELGTRRLPRPEEAGEAIEHCVESVVRNALVLVATPLQEDHPRVVSACLFDEAPRERALAHAGFALEEDRPGLPSRAAASVSARTPSSRSRPTKKEPPLGRAMLLRRRARGAHPRRPRDPPAPRDHREAQCLDVPGCLSRSRSAAVGRRNTFAPSRRSRLPRTGAVR